MKVVSVNVGRTEVVTGPGFESESGICKRPVAGPVAVGPLGLESDEIANQDHHGGVDQAVYVYRQEDYAWWSEQLGRELEPGLFGENLTLAGLPAPGVAVGARLVFPDLQLEVTAPRIPCSTLTARVGETGFAKRFAEARRPGLYCRVVTPGSVAAGTAFEISGNSEGPTVVDLLDAYYATPDAATIRRFLTAPVAHRTRAQLERQLADQD